VLECLSGDFIIDAASGGISALIDMAWQIYMYSSDKKSPFTVLIDEVENHLHPSMQRRILGDLINAFPHVSFIVTTHSPLIVGSVKDSFVYVLRYENDEQRHKVITEQLDLVNKAKTATEILDEVLGVSFTMPIWAEEELSSIVSKYLKEDITPESLSAMRSELATIGLEKLVPTAVTKLVQEKDAETK
jgi:predicted ATP-binding protein involved in virulence